METLKDKSFQKINTDKRWLLITDYVNNLKEYFKAYENIWCMIILKNILKMSLHIVFSISFDLIYDKHYPLYTNHVLVIVNPTTLS